MRVLIAPDSFGGTLSAVAAAEAIAAGWRAAAPGDELLLAPLSDGGPGFVDVVHAAVGGELLAVTVTGPLGDAVPATVLLAPGLGDGPVAYLESAQACGLHLVPADRRDPTLTSTYGVGELIAAAVDAGARVLVVGLGGSSTNDGGAGALAALGAEPAMVLRGGGGGLGALGDDPPLDLGAARARLAGVEVRIATDVDSPLLGLRGASAIFGPQKGADADAVQRLDAALEHFARRAQPGVGLNMSGSLAVAAGAGAAGGLGYGSPAAGRAPGRRHRDRPRPHRPRRDGRASGCRGDRRGLLRLAVAAGQGRLRRRCGGDVGGPPLRRPRRSGRDRTPGDGDARGRVRVQRRRARGIPDGRDGAPGGAPPGARGAGRRHLVFSVLNRVSRSGRKGGE